MASVGGKVTPVRGGYQPRQGKGTAATRTRSRIGKDNVSRMRRTAPTKPTPDSQAGALKQRLPKYTPDLNTLPGQPDVGGNVGGGMSIQPVPQPNMARIGMPREMTPDMEKYRQSAENAMAEREMQRRALMERVRAMTPGVSPVPDNAMTPAVMVRTPGGMMDFRQARNLYPAQDVNAGMRMGTPPGVDFRQMIAQKQAQFAPMVQRFAAR